MKACVLEGGVGEYNKLKLKDLPEPNEVGADDVLIQQNALGICFDDVMYRRGDYALPDGLGAEPILGFEGVGTVLRKGENVKSFDVGDQVGYGFAPFGSYAQQRVINYNYLVSIPTDITPEFAAGTLRRGLLVDSMLFKTFNAVKGDWILVHSVAGGVGHLLAKWAKFAGLRVIGTVCDDSKISTALATGCDYVIDRSTEDMPKKVLEYTEGYGVKALYDGVGKPVFEQSLQCLKVFGLYVSYGYAGGKLDPIDVMKLRERSLFFTTPVLELYKKNRYELLCSAASVIDMLKKGVIIPNISRYAMDGIPQAHADLESGKTMGSIVVNVY